jgi:hypothetical protein
LLHLSRMSKRAGNHRRRSTKASQHSPAQEAARRQRRAGRKTKLGQAPKRERAREPQAPESPVQATAKQREAEHARAYQRMNERERQAARRVKPVAERSASDVEPYGDQGERPRYLSDLARGMVRRVSRLALAPLTLARAVADRLRNRD